MAAFEGCVVFACDVVRGQCRCRFIWTVVLYWFIVLGLMVGAAFLVYVLRPRSLRMNVPRLVKNKTQQFEIWDHGIVVPIILLNQISAMRAIDKGLSSIEIPWSDIKMCISVGRKFESTKVF